MVDKTFTADAILQATLTKSFSVDAILEIPGQITLGILTLPVDFDGIRPEYSKISAKHTILGASNSKRQELGRDSDRYELKGIMEGVDRDTDMETLRNYYLNSTEVSFQGYTTLPVNVRVIEFQELNLFTYWEWQLMIEITGT